MVAPDESIAVAAVACGFEPVAGADPPRFICTREQLGALAKVIRAETERSPVRRRFVNRGASWTLTVDQAPAMKCHVTYRRFDDGLIGSTFITGGKPGGDVEAALRDLGLMISLALSYGVPISELYNSMTKLDDGEPAGTAGVVLQKLLAIEEGRDVG